MNDISSIFAEEEEKALAVSREEIAREDADPAIQAKRLIEMAAREALQESILEEDSGNDPLDDEDNVDEDDWYG